MATVEDKPLVMSLTTDMGEELKFRSMSAIEEMGRLFEFSVLALAPADTEVDPASLLGTAAVVKMELDHDGPRYFHGQVVRAGLESSVGSYIGWRLHLRPWLWQLTRRIDSRIFQNMTVENIIKKVFENYTGDVVWELSGSYSPRVYCVQYRETDFNFVSRLMEEEGMYYFHRHAEDKHTLVICDAMTSHADFPGHASFEYRESQDQFTDLEAITEWRHTQELTPGKVTLKDYDFTKPATDLKVEHTSVHDTAPAVLEHYDYPGLYTESSRGSNLARVRQQELDARTLRVQGSSTTVGALCVGYRFALTKHLLASENTDHVVLSTRIEAQYSGYESGQGETRFSCRFTAMRYAHVFRPERSTPKPVVAGPQTALVVGPSGEEIYTDAHGRVKVQFHWDRIGEKNATSSCWLRVASQWAGKGWGMINLPRIGQEVMVDFLEGDPDQPLVTGGVYNAVQVPPYALPDNKTISTLKSQSSKEGTTDNANELRFQDLKGSEHIWFQAEKDMRHLVKNNSHTWIKANTHRIVGGDLIEKVVGKHHLTIEKEQKILMKDNHQTEIKKNSVYFVGGTFDLSAGDTKVKAGATGVGVSSLDVASSGAIKIKGSTIDIKAGTSISIEAGTMISLKVGSNFVVIDPGMVYIKGSMVMINSGGSATAAQDASAPSPSKEADPDLPAEPPTGLDA